MECKLEFVDKVWLELRIMAYLLFLSLLLKLLLCVVTLNLGILEGSVGGKMLKY